MERALAVGQGRAWRATPPAGSGALVQGRDLAAPPVAAGPAPAPPVDPPLLPGSAGGEPAAPTEAAPPPPAPVYPATIGGPPIIRDLGFGPSDAARIEHLLASLEPASPLRGQGALILALGQEYNVDPLLIVVWAHESGLCTEGPNTPADDNWNCGNVVWAGMRPHAARWGCAPGSASLGHQWGACPTAEAGLGLWFEYVGTSKVYHSAQDLRAFAARYSPCSDPENARRGYACDAAFADRLLTLLRRHAGPPTPLPDPAAAP